MPINVYTHIHTLIHVDTIMMQLLKLLLLLKNYYFLKQVITLY